jgi:hypothetical protein
VSNSLRQAAVTAGATALAATALGIIALSMVRGGGETIGYALMFIALTSAVVSGSCFGEIWFAKSGFEKQPFFVRRLLVVCFIANPAPYIIGAALPRFADLLNAAVFIAAPAAMI